MRTRPGRTSPPPIRLGLGLASLVLAGFLFLGFKVPDDGTTLAGSATRTGSGSGSATTGGSGTSGGTGTSTGTGTSSGTGSAVGGSTSGSSSTGSSSAGKTYDGTLIDTRYGPVQVEITVSNGKVVAATAVELPSGGRSGMISGYVEPILSGEALQAQSANIDLVSGATYTSDAYARSLQAALDQAGL